VEGVFIIAKAGVSVMAAVLMGAFPFVAGWSSHGWRGAASVWSVSAVQNVYGRHGKFESDFTFFRRPFAWIFFLNSNTNF